MIRNGVNAMFSSGPMISPDGNPENPWIPKSKAALRIWHALAVGAIGSIAMWMLMSKLATGKLPTDDKRSKFMAIPVGSGNGPIDKYRHSKLGNALWGNNQDVGYLNLYAFNPLMRRGAMALGIPGAYETLILGGSAGQAAEAAEKDAMNTLMHPFAGPIPRAAFTGAFGKELYLTALRDRAGKLGPSFMPAIPDKTKPGLPTIWRQALASAEELNAFGRTMADIAGINKDAAAKKKDEGNALLLWILNMSLLGTGMVGHESNPYARKKAIHQQKIAEDRARYLDEQSFRYNNRKMTDGERFDIGVRDIIGKRLTYAQLTGKTEEATAC
jgi:hypothetical protein